MKCFLQSSVLIKIQKSTMAQQNEDRYGNEIKRRRMDDAGKHLKVWRVCEFKYAIKGQVPAFNEEEFNHQEEDEVVLQEEEVAFAVVQEVAVQEVAVVQEAVQEEEEAVQEVAVVQEDPVPRQVIGRTIIIYTVGNQTVRGIIQNLFDLNGERAIQIQTSAGENLIFTSSQMVGLEVLLNPNEQQLSPIVDHAVAAEDQIADDDFPDVEFQSARRPNQDQPNQDQPEEQECCAICLEMTDAARNFVSLDCGHQFHFGCIMGNLANGGQNRNQCPMCRDTVVQQHNEEDEEMIERLARGSQRLQEELDLNRRHREDLTEEYVRVMSMNMQIGMRHREERAALDALERRAYICGLNERIATVVLSAANNDIRQNYEDRGVRMHIERQVRELCICFGMMAYDAQYDDHQDQDQQQEDLMNIDPIEVD